MLRRGTPLSLPAAFALCVQATAPLSPPIPTSTDLPQTVPANMSQHPSARVSAVGLFARPRPLPSRPALFLRRAAAVFPALPLIYVAATCCCTPLHTAAHCCTPPHAARCSPLSSPRQAIPGPRQLSGPRPLWCPPVSPPGAEVKPPLFPYKPVSYPVPPVSASLRTEIHRCRPLAPGQPLSAPLLSHPLYLNRSAATAAATAAAITAAVPAPPAIQRPPPTRSALLSPYRPSPPPPPGCYPPPKSPKASKSAQKSPKNLPKTAPAREIPPPTRARSVSQAKIPPLTPPTSAPSPCGGTPYRLCKLLHSPVCPLAPSFSRLGALFLCRSLQYRREIAQNTPLTAVIARVYHIFN